MTHILAKKMRDKQYATVTITTYLYIQESKKASQCTTILLLLSVQWYLHGCTRADTGFLILIVREGGLLKQNENKVSAVCLSPDDIGNWDWILLSQ